MTPSYRLPTFYAPLPKTAYRLVVGEPDEAAALAAYASSTTLLDARAQQFPDRPLYGEVDIKTGTVNRFTYVQVRRLSVSFAKAYLDSGILKPRQSAEDRQVRVALLGVSAHDVVFNTMAIQRLGHAPLLISPGVPPGMVPELIVEAGAKVLLVQPGAEKRTDRLSEELKTLPRLPWQSSDDIKHQHALRWTDAETNEVDRLVRNSIDAKDWADENLAVTHTSGTTSRPKLVVYRTGTLMNGGLAFPAGAKLVTYSPYHAAFSQKLVATVGGGDLIMLACNHTPSPEDTIRLAELCPPVPILDVPMGAVHGLVDHPGGLDLLKQKFKKVHVGAGPLKPPARKALREHGIAYLEKVGSTEGHCMLTSDSETTDDTQWMKPTSPEHGGDYLHFEPYDEALGVYELVLKEGWPYLYACDREDGYVTRDLYERHPDGKNLWRYYARRDDVLVHTAGGKTNPADIEAGLAASPYVRDVLAVGDGRVGPAALVIPTTHNVTVDMLQHEIDRHNSEAQSWSHLLTGRVKMLDPDEEFEKSPKGSTNRGATMEKYRAVIDDIYR